MKKVTRPQYVRGKRILEIIRRGNHLGQCPNASDFGHELGVSRPTIMRDIEWLRDDEGAPIEYVPARHGYRLSDESWWLPPVSLNRREVFAFAVADKLLAAFRGTPIEADMHSALQKVAESIEGRITLDPAVLTDRLTVISEDYVEQDLETWSAVAEQLDRQERFRMDYERFDGMVRDYILEPYHLVAYHGNWYVVGQHVRKQRIATFAVSRIRSLNTTGESFEIPDAFDVREHVAKSFGIVRGEREFKVRLVFSSNVAGYVRERVWHRSQRVIRKRDGSVELQFRTAGWNELVRWVLSWQPDCHVVSPKRLRLRIAEKMRQGLRKTECGEGL